MSSRFASVFAITLAVLTPPAIADVYKCTDDDGSITYQDHPCAGQQAGNSVRTSRDRSGDAEDFDALFVPISGGKQAAIARFHTMTSAVHRGDPRAVTVRLNSKPGQEPLGMLLTFFDNPESKVFSDEQVSEIVLQMAEPHLENSFERRAQLYESPTEIGTAVFASVNDRRYMNREPPRGEYRTITVGQIPTSHTIVAFTILSNGTDNAHFRDALTILQSMQIILDEPQSPADSVAKTGRPPAPAGYQWQECPEIKGALLRPDNWYFRKEVSADTIAYFISEENTRTDGEFFTGFSMNVLKGVDRIMGAPPSRYAEELVAEAARSSHVRKKPWIRRMGPFVSHAVIVTTPDIVKGDFVTHMLAIANDTTGTMYLVTFESPVEDWQEASQIAEPMLKHIGIDSEI